MKYRKKPPVVEATQWWRNGDHPQDKSKSVDTAGGGTTLTEGKVVRYFRRLNVPGNRFCQECGQIMQRHGLLNGLNGEEVICPGDYIVTNKQGLLYRMRSVDFEAQYEPYDTVAHPSPKMDKPEPVLADEEQGKNPPKEDKSPPKKPEPITVDPGKVSS